MGKNAVKLHHHATEGIKSTLELSALFNPFSLFYLKALAPHAPSKKPVMVLPGFLAGDWSSKILRGFLNQKGYDTYGWDNGTNLGPSEKTIKHLAERLAQIHQATGEKVSLIGHSLGGVLARELSRAYPDKVSQVITLGSPFGTGLLADSTLPIVRTIFEVLNPALANLAEDDMSHLMLSSPPVPTSSLYSRTDGVVHWKTCITPEAEQSENIEIRASHCGLIVNPVTYAVILDRLSQDVESWQPFDRTQYPGLKALMRDREAHDDFRPVADPDKAGRAPSLFPE